MKIDVKDINDLQIKQEVINSGLQHKEFKEACEKLSPQALHYIRKWFELDEEELKLYFSQCGVDEESHFVWDSSDVTNSNAVSASTDVVDSSYVWHSEHINDSQNVYTSNTVVNSSDIYRSEEIHSSNKIIQSKNVSHSNSVLNSNSVEWCENISYSYDIEDSKYVYKSNNVSKCFFSGFLRNCTNCICCTNLVNKDYYIFNEPVTPLEFEKAKEELFSKLENETSTFITIDQQFHRENRVKSYFRLDNIFDGLSDEFYGYIGTIMNYNESDFLSIFFRS